MMDREKVLKGLEICTSIAEGDICPKDCPYIHDMCYGYDQLMRDALAVLKEQEAVVLCGDCKHGDPFNEGDVYCEKNIGTMETAVHKPNWFCADWEHK